MTRSRTAIDIQVAVAPLLDDANQCIGSIAVARDVTQHKRSEEALRLAREAAEAANHAKSSFLASMSHEIRTPMNGVLGMTELLLETGLTSTQRKYAETVQRSGKNLLGIINDILDFSKIEAGKLELENVDMDLRRTVEDVVDLLAERAHSKGLELACSIPADLVTHVRGDPLRLGQVLTNLVGNAIKFTEQGAVVIRVASIEETAKHVTHALRGQRHRLRHQPGSAIAHLRRVLAGRRLDHAQARRLRPGPRHQQAAGGNDGRQHPRRVRARRRLHLLVHQQLREAGSAVLEESRSAPMGMLTGVRALIVESSVDQSRHPAGADEQLGHEQPRRGHAGAGDRSAGAGGGARRALRHRDHRPGAAGHGCARARAHDPRPRRDRQGAPGRC